jgi:hypothetical protein
MKYRDQGERLHHVSVPRSHLVIDVTGRAHLQLLFHPKRNQRYIPAAKRVRLRKNDYWRCILWWGDDCSQRRLKLYVSHMHQYAPWHDDFGNQGSIFTIHGKHCNMEKEGMSAMWRKIKGLFGVYLSLLASLFSLF